MHHRHLGFTVDKLPSGQDNPEDQSEDVRTVQSVRVGPRRFSSKTQAVRHDWSVATTLQSESYGNIAESSATSTHLYIDNIY